MKKILICDDEAIIRMGIRKLLEQYRNDLEIRDCADGREGYKVMAVWNPDAVITDIRMPVMDGLAMIERAEEAGLTAKYVVISAYRDFEYARTAIRCGVREYILKPINRFELTDCLERLLGEVGKTEKEGEEPAFAEDDGSIAKDNGSIAKAIRYIENNFYRSISLEEVSRTVQMNSAYFSTLFRRQTGKKYIDYITDLRMKKARNLIQNTDLKIVDIAQMVGYSSTKHFARIYKEKYGTTPNEGR